MEPTGKLFNFRHSQYAVLRCISKRWRDINIKKRIMWETERSCFPLMPRYHFDVANFYHFERQLLLSEALEFLIPAMRIPGNTIVIRIW